MEEKKRSCRGCNKEDRAERRGGRKGGGRGEKGGEGETGA